ncbi:MAG: GNAT family N-acetyltransferase [Thermaerobacter sp.]|nr:GNAT family N-acetyltransferase [Thermaerobacter sp.]
MRHDGLHPLGGAAVRIRGWAEVTYFVPDVRAARDFVSQLTGRVPLLDKENLCQFAVGDGRLTIHPLDPKGPAGVAGQVAYWRLEDPDAMAHMIEWFETHGGQRYRGPMSGPDGWTACQVRDPFGNAWGFLAPARVEVRAAEPGDRPWLCDLWRREWGGETQEYQGTHHHVRDVDALVAWRGEARVGAATFVVAGRMAELVTLNADPRGQGIGSGLLARWEQDMAARGVTRLTLTTTNDNLDALALYQRRGYRLVRLNPEAVMRARMQKPSIPLTGEHGIALRDELVLAKALGGADA